MYTGVQMRQKSVSNGFAKENTPITLFLSFGGKMVAFYDQIQRIINDIIMPFPAVIVSA